MLDEWTTSSGTLSGRPSAWLPSLIRKRPMAIGAEASQRWRIEVITPASIAAATVIGLKVEPSS